MHFLYTSELLDSNPMPLIGRPKVANSLPKGLGTKTVSDFGSDRMRHRFTPAQRLPERDRALI
ncbi:hypothetical protein [Mycobacterium colombiense]|uniref:hypothetical protein n=1 Tax=Mycobacterium colombiense TaxID=339268 RepID=UPI0004B17732|nr:hypothetical protein [Mycobacterium colombiense]